MKKFFAFALQHKIKTLLTIAAVVVGGYFIYGRIFTKAEAASYITSSAEKGTLITSVSGTGQVSAENQIDLKPKSTGEITSVRVKVGDYVKKGQVLVTLDQRDAGVALTKAKATYASAESNYNKLTADLSGDAQYSKTAQLELDKAKIDGANSIATAQAAVDTAYSNLKMAEGGDQSQIVTDAYHDAVLFLQNEVVKLEEILLSVDNILGVDNAFANDEFEKYLSTGDISKLQIAEDKYHEAKGAVELANKQIVPLAINSDYSSIENGLALIETAIYKTIQLTNGMSDMLNVTSAVGDISSTDLDSMKSSMLSARSSATNEYSSLLAQRNDLDDAKDSYDSYKAAYDRAVRDLEAAKITVANNISDKELALKQSKEDVQSSKAQLESARAQLTSVYNDFSDTIIAAPFDGQIASVSARAGDQAAELTESAVTIITKQKVAEITLNEVDAAKVKTGQKVNISFDAIDDLGISGEVAEVDMIGTISQGVVSYSVKIVFDVQDERIKPGMSCSATIILDAKTDVLMVPSTAVKSQNSSSYVQVLVGGVPQKKTVIIGSSNDTMTEIISGINEGDEVVTQTITNGSSAAKTTNGTQSGTRSSGGPPAGMMFEMH